MNKLHSILLAGSLAYSVPGLADNADQIERGRYLAEAGDCVACHTTKDGARFAGGFPMATPFGTLYSTNITPDKEYGIGNYSDEDFIAAMRDGVSPHTGQLYPAMPYTSYAKVSDEDLLAIKAYLFSLKPVDQPNRENELPFPFSVRTSLLGWKLMYHDDSQWQNNPDKSTQWNRGGYLVEGLGHCGECHTPRNLAGAVDNDERFKGFEIAGFLAPDITSEGLKQKGWSKQDMVDYLTFGASSKGTAFGEMWLVAHNSSQHMNNADLNAVSTYLLDLDGPEAETPYSAREPSHYTAPKAEDIAAYQASAPSEGQMLYASYCAGCHGVYGQGKPFTFPPLKGNSIVLEDNPLNLVRVTANGIDVQVMSQTVAYRGMPGYKDELSAQQIAALSNYVRNAWGNQARTISTAEVSEIMANDSGHH